MFGFGTEKSLVGTAGMPQMERIWETAGESPVTVTDLRRKRLLVGNELFFVIKLMFERFPCTVESSKGIILRWGSIYNAIRVTQPRFCLFRFENYIQTTPLSRAISEDWCVCVCCATRTCTPTLSQELGMTRTCSSDPPLMPRCTTLRIRPNLFSPSPLLSRLLVVICFLWWCCFGWTLNELHLH